MRIRKQLLPLVMLGMSLLLILAAVGTVAGWILAGEPAAQSSPPSSPSLAHPDLDAKKACDMIETAREHNAWNDHGLVLNIVTATRLSADRDIAAAGEQVARSLAVASAAQGKPSQPVADRNLRADLEALERQCTRAGLP